MYSRAKMIEGLYNTDSLGGVTAMQEMLEKLFEDGRDWGQRIEDDYSDETREFLFADNSKIIINSWAEIEIG